MAANSPRTSRTGLTGDNERVRAVDEAPQVWRRVGRNRTVGTRPLRVAATLGLLCSSVVSAQVVDVVSRNSSGVPADSFSYDPSPSHDGRYVAFGSWAHNLVSDVQVSNPSVYLRDAIAGTTVLVTQAGGRAADGDSYLPAISADGGTVVFWSKASNLVPNDTNGGEDLFAWDRATGTLSRVAVSSTGEQPPSGSGNHFGGYPPSVSGDGRLVAFDTPVALAPDDADQENDVYVRDRATGTTACVTCGTASLAFGSIGAAISEDGRFVAFKSWETLIPADTDGQPDVYVYDRQTQTLELIADAHTTPTAGAGATEQPALSGDGRYVAFVSDAPLISGDTNGLTDVFIHDRSTHVTTRASVASDGSQANGPSWEPTISGDGRYVAFRSGATNLVLNDHNGIDDLFVHDLQTGQTTRINVSRPGLEAQGPSWKPVLSADGLLVVFRSNDTKLDGPDGGAGSTAYLAVRADFCPDDPAKLFPGVCGCGIPDTDTDRDRVPDCQDGCPNDPAKIAPGVCGCGVADTDSDADGIPDCNDPVTRQALAMLVYRVLALTKSVTRTRDPGGVFAELATLVGYLTNAHDNAAFTAKQKARLAAATDALRSLPGASGRTLARRRAKALRLLRKLLRALGA
jgi:Tol biopolymer transport system component